MLSVSLLGDFRILHDTLPVTGVDSPRLQSLLAYLMLHSGTPQSRAHVAFLFWPDTTEDQARTNLRNLLHHLRHALPNADSYLNVSVQALEWRPEGPLALDVADFDSALAQAERAANPASARGALEQARSLYKGDLLPSCYDDWILPQRERLRQAYLGALERLVGLLEDERDYPAAIQNAQLLLQHDPLHEGTYRRLIRLHALNGDRASALRVYHTCATVLQRELEVEPSAATREAYEQLLGEASPLFAPLPATAAFSPLVGREKEWSQLQQLWRTAAAGDKPHAVLLRGEAGIGKTRLAEDLLQWANRQGITSANARCYAAEGDLAYGPVSTWLHALPLPPLDDAWLAEVARLLPETLTQRPDLPRPAALTEAWQREHLFEALSRAILGMRQPLLLTIDDLQWCPRDTLEWLHFLMRFGCDARLLVVGTYRPEEIGHGHPLTATLHALRMEGQVTEMDLGPLDEPATAILAARVAGRELSAETLHDLYQETEGNPLFVVETVRAGLPAREQRPHAGLTQRLPGDSFPGSAGLPPKVQSVLEARLAQLSPPTRELAGLAATIGREFSFDLLANASGDDEYTAIHGLDELWQRRIVRERGANAYDFTHGKLREVAYNAMSATRRQVLHRHAARALETLNAADLDPVSRQVAAHYERAGLPEFAAPYYLRAAKAARKVFANEDAIALLRRGLALADTDSQTAGECGGTQELAACIWEELADILELRAQHEEALEAYHSAQARTPSKDRIWQARLHRKASVAVREQRRYADALHICQQAEIALGEQHCKDDDPWWAEWLEVQVERIWAHYWLAQWREMDGLVNKVKPVVHERGGAANRQRFLWASCMMQLRKRRYAVSDDMISDAREMLALSLELHNLKTRTECRFELGFLHLWRRELDEAEDNLRAALQLAETAGIAGLRTLSLTYLTVLYRFHGDVERVLTYALRAQDAAVSAQMPDYVAVAKSNQAWIAVRNHDLSAAEQDSLEALAIWQQSPLIYPFQWQALWPLIATALARGQTEKAWDYAQAMLEPTQQHLPDILNTPLETAIQARVQGQTDKAHFHLHRAAELAKEMGYL